MTSGRRHAAFLAALCVALGTTAAATAAPWGKKSPRARSKAEVMRELDVTEADAHMLNARQRLNIVQQGNRAPVIAATLESQREAEAAIDLYRKAAALKDDAELHYRAFYAAQAFFIEGPGTTRWQVELDEFDAFRAADPKDPRETELLPEICTALSKLGGAGTGADADAYFARGVKEFELWRSRIDTTNDRIAEPLSMLTVNAAELVMALGPDRIEEAIDDYQKGVELNPYESLGWYGLAVAADRNGEWSRAVAAMKQAMDRDYDPETGQRMTRLHSRGVYFVPDGDVDYYEALRAQITGDDATALELYTQFLTDCPTTKYAARAQQHIAELKKSKGKGGATRKSTEAGKPKPAPAREPIIDPIE